MWQAPGGVALSSQARPQPGCVSPGSHAVFYASVSPPNTPGGTPLPQGTAKRPPGREALLLDAAGPLGALAGGWGCCLGPEHWPLRGCRARPGPPLGVGPDTIRALSLRPQARPSLHLVQRPRQPARGRPAQLAGTPGARPQPAWTPVARLREAHPKPGADGAPHPEGLHQSGCQETPALPTPDRASCRAPGNPGVPPVL